MTKVQIRYAEVAGKRREAQVSGERGKCPCCGAEVIAKCGEQRVHHWAHKNISDCAFFKKESKTEWHLRWQNYFPEDWREIVGFDPETNEKHIADVKTPGAFGLVIEFQHSDIKTTERESREKFYKNMIWGVDGTRLKSYLKNILDNPLYLKELKQGRSCRLVM